MSSVTTIPITEARQRIFEIADLVQKASTHFTLTQHGRPKAVIMSAAEFESWRETLEVMRDFPDLKKDIAEAERDYKAGNYVTLDELWAKEGFAVADRRSSKRYGISGRRTKKGTKKSTKN